MQQQSAEHSSKKTVQQAADQPGNGLSIPAVAPFTVQEPRQEQGASASVLPTGNTGAQQHHKPFQLKEQNNTGLPDKLKAGIENLSGFSMDDTKVHYNSGSPAQLSAFAYAQGNDIHLGPGQEKHLPHEAWHVVQQKQGRVTGTLQMKGFNINDDPHLEDEADKMGQQAQSDQNGLNRALRGPVAPSAISPVQRAAYMRALTGDNRIGGEIDSLRRIFIDETNRQGQVNTWVNGFAGMPTARNTGNDRHYFSPVGYKLETNADADVLQNYAGDGNTNDITVGHDHWLGAIEHLRPLIVGIADYMEWAEDRPDYLEAIPTPEQVVGMEPHARQQLVNDYFRPYLRLAPLAAGDAVAQAARTQGQIAMRTAIQQVGLNDIRAHYAGAQGPNNNALGAGVNPQGMQAAIGNNDIRYIESILHARFNQVTGVWYNRHPGAYPAEIVQEGWRHTDAEWLAHRDTSAQAFQAAFAAEQLNVPIEVIGPAVQAQPPPALIAPQDQVQPPQDQAPDAQPVAAEVAAPVQGDPA